jgi:hypothetical protein
MPETIAGPNTKIEIISLASTICGRQSFNTLDAGGAFALDGEKIFNTLVSAELGSNRWRFSQHFQGMGTLTTINPSFDGWLYYWTMPSDLIMLFYLDPMVDYRVFGDRVLTRTNQPLTAVYSRNVPVSKWPPSFSMYMSYHLASILAISVTNSDRMVARINADKELWHSRALFSDGQNTRPERIRSNPYIDVRYRYSTRSRG